MGSPRRAARLALALWILWAVIVWNVVFDHAVIMAARAYLHAAAAAARGPGPYVRMDDWMHPAVVRGLWTATASALAIASVGVLSVRWARSEWGRGTARVASTSGSLEPERPGVGPRPP